MPGPPRKESTRLTLIKGNPGHRTKQDLQPGIEVEASTPKPPAWTKVFPTKDLFPPEAEAAKRKRKTAKEEWDRVAPILAAKKVFTDLDYECLLDYCYLVARHREVERIINEAGETAIGDHNKVVRHPLSSVANALRIAKLASMKQLFLTPASRNAAIAEAKGGARGTNSGLEPGAVGSA